MRYATFFRNMNLGRPHCPTRQQLEEAFGDAGARAAASFLTNGTIAFEASSPRAAQRIVRLACEALAQTCGLQEPAFLRELVHLEALVARQPFDRVDRDAVYDCYVTFLHADAALPDRFPRASPRGDVEIVHRTAGEVLCVAYARGKSAGSPNAFLEKALGLPTTTRAWNTIVRLVGKHAA